MSLVSSIFFTKISLKFTMDHFDDNNVHFLDMVIDKIDTDFYYKPTNTEPYSSFNSFLSWNYKTSWIKITLSPSQENIFIKRKI